MASDPPQLSDDSILELVFNNERQPTVQEHTASETPEIIEIEPQLLAQLKEIETRGVQLAEQNKLQEAIELFSEAIAKGPTYASAYNNRAQAYRILGNQANALQDLEQAIVYGREQPKIMKQAYTQRAIIRRSQGDNEGAHADFEQGAWFGNPVARALAVYENPYSRLCNATLLEVMQREYQQP